MNRIRRFGRRRSDRVIWIVALLAVAGLVATYAVSCHKSDSPTGPSGVPDADVSPSGGQVGNQDTAPAPVANPTPDPNQNFTGKWQNHISFDADGKLTISNPTTSRYEGEYCYFWNGAHPQTRIWKGKTSVAGGHSATFPKPNIEFPKGECGKREVQADAGAFSFNCDNPSNQLADAGTDDLHAYVYFTVEGPKCECEEEPVEIGRKVVREGQWSECSKWEFGCRQAKTDAVEITWKQCDTVWTETVRDTQYRSCECPCTPEWKPGDWEYDWNDPEECKAENVLYTLTDVKMCPGTQYQDGTRTRTWTNQCNDRTRTETEFINRTRPCETECPVPSEDYCHISNKGKDGQMNLVITGNGHASHTNPDKFCPPDLLNDVCSCDAAKEAAVACGFPADGGFYCKDNRN